MAVRRDVTVSLTVAHIAVRRDVTVMVGIAGGSVRRDVPIKVGVATPTGLRRDLSITVGISGGGVRRDTDISATLRPFAGTGLAISKLRRRAPRFGYVDVLTIPQPPPDGTPSLEIPTTPDLMATSSFWRTPLPDNAATTSETGAVQAALVRLVNQSGTTINTTLYTPTVRVVAAGQPNVPVRLATTRTDTSASVLRQLLLDPGVPVPSDYVTHGNYGAGDTDHPAVIYQPGWVSLDGTLHGLEWDLWRFEPNTDPATLAEGVLWQCQWAGPLHGTLESSGHYVDRCRRVPADRASQFALPTDPVKRDLFEMQSFSSTAAKVPLLPGLIKASEIRHGLIGHAIRMAVPHPATGHRWPAYGDDGGTVLWGTTTPNWNPVQEGTRLRLPPGWTVPSGMNPVLATICEGIRDYGLVVTDKAGAVVMFSEPTFLDLIDSIRPAALMRGLPWSQLQVLATGSDTNPNPTA